MRLAPLILLAALVGPGPVAGGPDSPGSEPVPSAAEREDARRLPFVADDYAKALGEARARSLPSLHRGLGPLVTHLPLDEGLRLQRPGPREPRRTVRLARPEHRRRRRTRPRCEKHEADALPTFLVVDPKDESGGPALGGQLQRAAGRGAFLEEAREKLRSAATPASPADAALDRADRLYGKRDYSRRGRAPTARRWRRQRRAGRRYNRAVEALLFSYQSTRGLQATPSRSPARRWPGWPGTPRPRSSCASGLDSAVSCRQDDHGRAAAIAEFEAALQGAIADPRLMAAADDRSGAYLSLHRGPQGQRRRGRCADGSPASGQPSSRGRPRRRRGRTSARSSTRTG